MAEEGEAYVAGADTTNSELICPIIDHNNTILGVVNAESDTVGDFGGEDYRKVLKKIARLVVSIFCKAKDDELKKAMIMH